MTVSSSRTFGRDVAIDRSEVRRDSLIPSWVLFSTILLAAFAVCVSVTIRTRAEAATAAQQYQVLSTQVQAARESNVALAQEVRRLNSDPRAIEMAARTRLNMVRANEIVVPVE
jgi:cell division protein FtsB